MTIIKPTTPTATTMTYTTTKMWACYTETSPNTIVGIILKLKFDRDWNLGKTLSGWCHLYLGRGGLNPCPDGLGHLFRENGKNGKIAPEKKCPRVPV